MGSWRRRGDYRVVRRLSSIYFRLVIPLGITLLLAMLAAWAIAVQLLTDTINRRLDVQLDHATAILADGEFPFSLELISRFDQLIEARIVLLDESGTIKLSTTTADGNRALATLSDRISDIGDRPFMLLTSEAGDNAWRIAVRRLSRQRDSRFHYVVAAASLDQTRQAAANAASLLGAAMLFATILLAWFGHYFTRGITGPVSDLASMADRIADGERDISSDYAANNEIGLLARALNGMTRRLAEYESELARQSHLAGLGDLAARLAHEVRNPLTALKMQLQLLQESVADDEADRVARLLDEIRRMELMVDSALTLGAPLVLNRSDVDPGTVIGELAKLLQPALSHRNIDLQTVVNHSRNIDADPDRLRQVLLNLINNAADELPEGGVIRVSSCVIEEDNIVELIVEDSGPGMPPEAAGQGRRKPFGLGLGLTICHEIVELHGGDLKHGASSELGGARFTIRLHVPIIEPSEPMN